jgi:hypothetical protein
VKNADSMKLRKIERILFTCRRKPTQGRTRIAAILWDCNRREAMQRLGLLRTGVAALPINGAEYARRRKARTRRNRR